jgi:hypothetical protein
MDDVTNIKICTRQESNRGPQPVLYTDSATAGSKNTAQLIIFTVKRGTPGGGIQPS